MASQRVTKSTGNVYADLGIKNAEDHALKAGLVRQITATLKEESPTQTEAARRLGVSRPKVSNILRGHFRQFSVERLMRLLVALGRDVEIVVRSSAAARSRAAQLTVSSRR